MNVILDLETLPAADEAGEKERIAAAIEAPAQMKKPETIKAWHEGSGDYIGVKAALIEEQYRRQSLNGAKGRICSLTFAVDGWADLHSFYLLPPGATLLLPETDKDGSLHTFTSERDLLRAFCECLVPQLNGRPPYFVGHYIGGFDLRFLWQRIVVNSVRPGFGIMQDGRHDKDFYDTMSAWAGYKGSISADALSEALGILPLEPGEITGAHVFDAYKRGDHWAVLHHNRCDIRRSMQHYQRLTLRC